MHLATKNICFIIGTRPEAIKMAPIIKACQQYSWLNPIILATAQHRELMDTMFTVFKLSADKDFDIMTSNQSLSRLTSKLLDNLEENLSHKYDVVLSQGDTTTVFATALACFYKQIPFAHIEAGLRTGNMHNPFPEEMNRVLAGRLTSWHFAPTELAKQNLVNEGVPASNIYVTGNTVIDALLATKPVELSPSLKIDVEKRFVLITAHRRENFGQPLRQICEAIAELAILYPETNFVYPVHPNPNVTSVVQEMLGKMPNVKLIPPVNYEEFITLMRKCYFIMTDSGGVEEEAPALNKPVLVLRDLTERPEIIEMGVGELVGSNKERIISAGIKLLANEAKYKSMCKNISPYGDGHAAEKIVSVLSEKLKS